MKVFGKNRGITLVALVVTIVVLLILAGVTISALSGDNGILSQAARAKQENEKASIIEEIRLDIAAKQTDNLGSINEVELFNILGKYGTVSDDGTTLITNKGEYKILISDICKLQSINMFQSNTVDVSYRNNILSLNSNDNTNKNANIISCLGDTLEIERKTNVDMQYMISILGNDEHFIYLFLHPGQGIKVYEVENDIATHIYTIVYYNQLPSYQGNSRFKFTLINNSYLKIELLQDKEWIDFYTIDINDVKNKTNFVGDINFGLAIDKYHIGDGIQYAIYNNVTDSKLYCKKISFLGDSITGNNIGAYSYYPAMVTTNVGAICKSHGYGGSSLSGGLNSIPSFVERFTKESSSYYEKVSDDSDIILIFGGNNGDKEIGTMGDTDENTTYGALKILIEYFSNNYPNSILIFATPIQGATYDEAKQERVEAIKEVCNFYSIPVIDLYNNSGITTQNASTYLKDGVHPNEGGNRLIADYLSEELLKLDL